jgi:hypothetical protein
MFDVLFYLCIMVCVSSCHYLDAPKLDNLQDLQEQDFEQFEYQGKWTLEQ